MNRDDLQRKFYRWLQPEFPLAYSNPQNMLIVPFETTRVVVSSEPLESGRSTVNLRSSILMDLELSDRLTEYVAMHCSRFRFGSLYLYRADDLVDLDYSNTVMDTWLDDDALVELVNIAGNNAVSVAHELRPRFGGRLANPSATARKTSFIGSEGKGCQDVWKALNDALETQRCLVIATAERIELSGIGLLTDGWVVVNTEFAWLAGRDHATRAITLWRIPHTDVVDTRVIEDPEVPASVSQLARGNALTICTRTGEATVALRDALTDPRDPNGP